MLKLFLCVGVFPQKYHTTLWALDLFVFLVKMCGKVCGVHVELDFAE